jgi:D-glycero-D-manno-heptose 1,7-bisphosphate phosphatase
LKISKACSLQSGFAPAKNVGELKRNKALFLDRDGVININHGYVYQTKHFDLIEGVIELIRLANQMNYKVIVVSNQSGIGRGYFCEQQFISLCDWMIEMFAQHNARIDKLYFCPHHPTDATGRYLKDCEHRKPKIGMALNAQNDLSIDLAKSIMVGDKQSDVDFAVNANMGKMYWIDPAFGAGSVGKKSDTTLHQISHLNMISLP